MEQRDRSMSQAHWEVFQTQQGKEFQTLQGENMRGFAEEVVAGLGFPMGPKEVPMGPKEVVTLWTADGLSHSSVSVSLYFATSVVLERVFLLFITTSHTPPCW